MSWNVSGPRTTILVINRVGAGIRFLFRANSENSSLVLDPELFSRTGKKAGTLCTRRPYDSTSEYNAQSHRRLHSIHWSV